MSLVRLILLLVKKSRVLFYSVVSTKKIKCEKVQPVLFNGDGQIVINENVVLGVEKSPGFYSGYMYIEARNVDSYIEIGENCIINNSASIISDGMRIIIKPDCLIGYNLEILDSDFHGIAKESRRGRESVKKGNVTIESNVFIGNNVTILKGITIGQHSVVANGAVVTKSVPSGVIVGGNPAKVLRSL